MKSITEILGGAQILLGLSYDIQECFEEYLNEEYRTFLAVLRVVGEHLPGEPYRLRTRGRPSYGREGFIRAFLAMNFFQIPTHTKLIQRLRSDSVLRRICGFGKVPSAASFSRRLEELSREAVLSRVLKQMVQEVHRERIVGHVVRDSTAIEAREKPVNRKKEVRPLPKRKRGRPRKGEHKTEKKVRRLARQLAQKPGKALRELDQRCSWGCKKNSQGTITYWKGYKLHLDVSEFGIPLTAVVTGAHVHDSQVALPMEKLTERRVQHLYTIMDSAYDAPEIRSYSTQKGRQVLVERNPRRGGEGRGLDPAQRERFKIRSVGERAYAHLKDYLIPSKLFVRGHRKVELRLLCGVVCLAAVKILQYFILPLVQT